VGIKQEKRRVFLGGKFSILSQLSFSRYGHWFSLLRIASGGGGAGAGAGAVGSYPVLEFYFKPLQNLS
jgi:hypothetical protein